MLLPYITTPVISKEGIAKYPEERNLMHNSSRFLLPSVVEMAGRRLAGSSFFDSHFFNFLFTKPLDINVTL